MTEEKNEGKVQEESRDTENKSYGLGVRHLQMFCMTFTMVSLIISRAGMGIAVLAMSDDGHQNATDIKIIRNITANDTNNQVTEITDTGTYVEDIDSDDAYNDNVYNEINDTYNDHDDDVIRKTIETYPWDKKTQSLILSSFFWGYVWMQIPAGILAKKFGGKSVLLVALVTNCVICALVPTFASVGGWKLVCASRVAMGLTQACLFPATHTLLGQWLPESERTNYVGVVYAGIQLGTIIAMPLCGLLAVTTIGWKLIFYVTAGLLFFNSCIWYWFAASFPREHRMISQEEREYIEAGLNVSEKKASTPWKQILRCVPVWVLVAPHFGFAMNFILFFVDMPTYLEKALQISLKDSSLLSALPYVGMWVGSVVSGILSGWLLKKKLVNLTASRKIFQSICQFGVAAGLIVLSFLGPESKTLAVVTLVGILTTAGFSTSGFIVNQLDLSPNYAGVIISICNFFANFGSVSMPIATSYILQNDSSNVPRWRWVFLFMAAVSISTNIVYLVFGSSKRQDWDDPNFLIKKTADPEEMQPVMEKDEKEQKEKENAKCQ